MDVETILDHPTQFFFLQVCTKLPLPILRFLFSLLADLLCLRKQFDIIERRHVGIRQVQSRNEIRRCGFILDLESRDAMFSFISATLFLLVTDENQI